MISKITAIIMAIVSIIMNLSGVLPTKQVFYTDVAYGTHENQLLDICFPENPEKNEGVVIFLHGGAWVQGSKSTFDNRVRKTTKAVGCISASIGYRFVSKTTHCTDLLKDIDAALIKIKSMAETRGINCDKVMLVGFSAGAHLATLYSYTKKYSAPITPCAVVSYSAPTDLRNEDFLFNNSSFSADTAMVLMSYLTGVNLLNLSEKDRNTVLYKYSPIKYLSSDSVPTLAVHGALDTVVPVEDARIFKTALIKNEVIHEYIELPDSGHSLDNDTYLMEKSEAAFVDFVNMYLK